MRAFPWRVSAGGAPPSTTRQAPQQSPPPEQKSYVSPATPQRAPDMSAFQPFPGARQNDLTSSNLPFNLWGPAATNAANRAMGNSSQIQSWTLPGYSQSFDGLTGQPRSQPTASWEGNKAYEAPDQRPGPVNWQTTDWTGKTYDGQQGWQQLAGTRDAFAGGLIQRLGQYQSGQQTGQPTFDFQRVLGQANDALQNNAWRNPFMDPRASTPQPSLFGESYSPAYYQAPYKS